MFVKPVKKHGVSGRGQTGPEHCLYRTGQGWKQAPDPPETNAAYLFNAILFKKCIAKGGYLQDQYSSHNNHKYLAHERG